MEFDSREFLVNINEINNNKKHFSYLNHEILIIAMNFLIYQTMNIGTSIGFKNIASKIAYDLRLWLGANDPPTKELLYEINDLDTAKPDNDNDNENEPGTKSSNKGIAWNIDTQDLRRTL